MRHIPAHCPDVILNVHPGQTLAACDWKELVFVDGTEFAIYQKAKAQAVRKRGFAQARDYYNALPYPEPSKHRFA